MAISRTINHPYFHPDLTEQQAKALLSKKEGGGHYLFCPAREDDEVLLIYRAKFRGNYEERTKKYSPNDLDGAGEYLTDFLHFSDEVFKPKPVMRLSSMILIETEDSWGMFVAPEILLKVLQFLTLKEAVKCTEVSKGWKLLINSNMSFFTNKQNELNNMNNARLLETGKFIMQTLQNILGVDEAGCGNSRKKLSLNGAELSAPNWYRDAIMVDFKCSSTANTCSIILEPNGELEWIEHSGSIGMIKKEEIYSMLEAICKQNQQAFRH